MRALVLERKEGPGAAALADIPAPQGAHPWAKGERLLVQVRAAAVAFPDVLQSRGLYQHGAAAPYVVGGEFAGEVLETPLGSRFQVGDRVAGLSVWGALAEQVLAIPRHTVKLPDRMSFAEGAAFYLNYVTALFTLRRSGFTDGESVLVHGAAGGVGTATLDLLRGRACPSIAVVSTPAKAKVAVEAGADVAVLTTEPWSARARELNGGDGIDVVVDPVGGDRFTDSLRALDVGGRLMVVGFAEGTIPTIQANRLLLRDLSVLGVALDPWEQRFPGTASELGEELEFVAAKGRVHPLIGDRLPFERSVEALGIVDERRARGKVVVEL
jgi:NADPH2:quinone reductase